MREGSERSPAARASPRPGDRYTSSPRIRPRDQRHARTRGDRPGADHPGYRDEEEAIAIANDTPYGLAAYVQSGDVAHARRVASRLRAGQVNINGAAIDRLAPFGGYKQSGNGREWGEHAFGEFLEVKAVLGYGAEEAANKTPAPEKQAAE